MTVLVEARGLTAGYGANAVVRDLDLTVEAGETVALLGPNGAGKTTTLRTLSGQIPTIGGDVLFDGDSTSAPLHRRAQAGLGIVTEQRAVFTRLTVAENLRVSRCSQSKALALFPELEPNLHRRVGLLSGGQQQMLALARALARESPPLRLLMIDEISLGLAPQITDRLLRTVAEAAASGIGVLLVEQHIHKALQVADRAYVMRRGKIQLSGRAAELRDQERKIEDSYLLDSSADEKSRGKS